MKIKTITATPVTIPYAAPVGPYIGRGGLPGTLGAHGLVVRVETDAGLVGWAREPVPSKPTRTPSSPAATQPTSKAWSRP